MRKIQYWYLGKHSRLMLGHESQIVTTAQTILGNENEGNEVNLESLVQKEDEKGLTSEAVVCDALYDSLSNRVNIEKREKKKLYFKVECDLPP